MFIFYLLGAYPYYEFESHPFDHCKRLLVGKRRQSTREQNSRNIKSDAKISRKRDQAKEERSRPGYPQYR